MIEQIMAMKLAIVADAEALRKMIKDYCRIYSVHLGKVEDMNISELVKNASIIIAICNSVKGEKSPNADTSNQGTNSQARG